MRFIGTTETGQPSTMHDAQLGPTRGSLQDMWGNLNMDRGLNNSSLSTLTTNGVTYTYFAEVLGHR